MQHCIDLISRSACLGSRQRSVVCATVIQCSSCFLHGWLQVILLSCTLATSVWAAPHDIIHLSLSQRLQWTIVGSSKTYSSLHIDLVIYCDPFPTQIWGDQNRFRNGVLLILQLFKIQKYTEWPGSSMLCHWIYAKNEPENEKICFVCC